MSIVDVLCSSIRARGRRYCKFLISSAGYYDYLGLQISRHWGQNPFWFSKLNDDDKKIVLAEYRLSFEDAKKRKDRKLKEQRRILEDRKDRAIYRGAYYGQNKNKKR